MPASINKAQAAPQVSLMRPMPPPKEADTAAQRLLKLARDGKNKDYQEVMIYLNLADDYFKAVQEARRLQDKNEELEKEVYSLKHELIGVQMKLDAAREESK